MISAAPLICSPLWLLLLIFNISYFNSGEIIVAVHNLAKLMIFSLWFYYIGCGNWCFVSQCTLPKGWDKLSLLLLIHVVSFSCSAVSNHLQHIPQPCWICKVAFSLQISFVKIPRKLAFAFCCFILCLLLVQQQGIVMFPICCAILFSAIWGFAEKVNVDIPVRQPAIRYPKIGYMENILMLWVNAMHFKLLAITESS